jgi:glutathione S-transferase
MAKPVLYGPGFSTYVRSARIALAEKGVDYDQREFNFLEGWPDGYEKLHPFRKVPAFEHDGTVIYETPAIMVYVDTKFEGPALLPNDALLRSRAVQVINVVDNYAYGSVITRTFIPRAVVPMLGGTPDEETIAEAQGDCERALAALTGLLGSADYFGGSDVSLADFHVVPVLHYASQIPEGQAQLAKVPALGAWAERMGRRESVRATVPAFG